MAYALQDRAEHAQLMVIDLGGGTFDISIMEYFDGVLEVHASAGDNFLGGEDFLEVLVQEYLMRLVCCLYGCVTEIGESGKLNHRERFQNPQQSAHNGRF